MGKLTHTVKGPIASFRSADVAPIESLKLHFLPKQEGSGDPSPTNVRPITGWTGCNLFGSGRNLLNLDRTVGDGGEYGGTTKRILDINKFYLGLAHSNYYLASYINDYNINNQNKTIMVNSSSSPYGVAFPLPCKGGQSYHIHCEVDDDDETRFRYNWYQADGTYISNETIKPLNRVCDYTKTVPENAAILCMIFTSPVNTNRTYHNIYVSIDSKNEYTPFNGLDVIPMTWSSHGVEYGGYIDPIAGEIVAEWIKYVCTGNEELTKWSLYGSSSNIAAKLPRSLCSGYYFDGAKNAMCNLENSVSNIQMYYGYTAHGICISNNGYITIQVDGITTLDAMSEWLAENKPEIIFKTDVPRRYTLTSQQIKTFLDYNNFWSDMNDDTEVEYAFRDHLLTERRRIIAARNEGELIFWLNANDAPVDNCWVDRVRGINFELRNGAGQDTINNVYDFTDNKIAGFSLYSANLNRDKVDFGHHFRIEFDTFYRRTNSGIFIDAGSLTSADKAVGFGFASRTSNNMSCNWKMNGNSSNPWSASGEARTHPNMPEANNSDYEHLVGFFEIIDGGDGYDRLRVKINNKIVKYNTQIPKVKYGPDWDSQNKYFTIGAGVYNYNVSHYDPDYSCNIKIREIKIYKYD